MRVYIGVDPGVSGAMAVINGDDEVIGIHDWKEVNDIRGAAGILMDYINFYDYVYAAIESVHSMPGQGVSSTFKFGRNFGQWEGLMAGLNVPTRLVRPQEWQKGVISRSDGKNASLAAARRLFPEVPLNLKRHHNRADALLIADWLLRTQG